MDFIIKYTESRKEGVDYFGVVKNMNLNFEKIMKEICKENNVSLYWVLEKNGDMFISIDFCAAQICHGLRK